MFNSPSGPRPRNQPDDEAQHRLDQGTDTLYVDSTADNATVKMGTLVFTDSSLRGPLALKFAPNGNLLTANGDAVNSEHHSRRLIHCNLTAHPSANWTRQQLCGGDVTVCVPVTASLSVHAPIAVQAFPALADQVRVADRPTVIDVGWTESVTGTPGLPCSICRSCSMHIAPSAKELGRVRRRMAPSTRYVTDSVGKRSDTDRWSWVLGVLSRMNFAS